MMNVSCKELRKRAWDRLSQGGYGLSLGVSFLGSLINGAAGIFTSGAISYGTCKYYAGQQRGKKPELETMFEGFSLYGRTFVTGLLQSIFLFLWSLLFVIPGIIKGYSYALTGFVMSDFDISGEEAITKSRELMNGYKWKLFCLRLSFIGWVLLAAFFTCGIGSIFLAPYMAAAEAEFYAEVLRCHDIIIGETAQDADATMATEATDVF